MARSSYQIKQSKDYPHDIFIGVSAGFIAETVMERVLQQIELHLMCDYGLAIQTYRDEAPGGASYRISPFHGSEPEDAEKIKAAAELVIGTLLKYRAEKKIEDGLKDNLLMDRIEEEWPMVSAAKNLRNAIYIIVNPALQTSEENNQDLIDVIRANLIKKDIHTGAARSLLPGRRINKAYLLEEIYARGKDRITSKNKSDHAPEMVASAKEVLDEFFQQRKLEHVSDDQSDAKIVAAMRSMQKHVSVIKNHENNSCRLRFYGYAPSIITKVNDCIKLALLKHDIPCTITRSGSDMFYTEFLLEGEKGIAVTHQALNKKMYFERARGKSGDAMNCSKQIREIAQAAADYVGMLGDKNTAMALVNLEEKLKYEWEEKEAIQYSILEKMKEIAAGKCFWKNERIAKETEEKVQNRVVAVITQALLNRFSQDKLTNKSDKMIVAHKMLADMLQDKPVLPAAMLPLKYADFGLSKDIASDIATQLTQAVAKALNSLKEMRSRSA